MVFIRSFLLISRTKFTNMPNKILSLIFIFAALWSPTLTQAQKSGFPSMKQLQSPQNPRLGFVIHGGAGVILKGSLTPEKELEYRKKLEEAVVAGYKALQAGKTSLDAVEIAIRILEDSPLFNAGKGAVFNHDGVNELDAAIMNGADLSAGAIAGVHRVKNPITLARAVMEKSSNVLLVGDGAEKFAAEQNVELVDPKYFFTPERYDALRKILDQEKPIQSPKPKVQSQTSPLESTLPANRYGTVGAVALDKNGNLAAGTSTGGLTNKRFGRVGDVPIIGAGTFADNETCAVSATGTGEYFIRLGVARDIATQMAYRAFPVQQAADASLAKVKTLGGDGGVIALDKFGNIGISFNSEGMYRAYINSEGKSVVEIYK